MDRAGIVSGPTQPGKYSFINLPLAGIITIAFNVTDFDVVGLPGWTRTTKYDVIGTYPEGANPQTQHRQMIQNVLADRSFGAGVKCSAKRCVCADSPIQSLQPNGSRRLDQFAHT